MMKTATTGFSIEEILSKEQRDDITYHKALPSLSLRRYADDEDEMLIRPRLLRSPSTNAGKSGKVILINQGIELIKIIVPQKCEWV